jgi:hypothetical protein
MRHRFEIREGALKPRQIMHHQAALARREGATAGMADEDVAGT